MHKPWTRVRTSSSNVNINLNAKDQKTREVISGDFYNNQGWKPVQKNQCLLRFLK